MKNLEIENRLTDLYARLDKVNNQRASLTNNNTRLIWLNGQRDLLLEMIQEIEK